MNPKFKKVRFSVSLQKNKLAQLDQFSKDTGFTRTYCVEMITDYFFEKLGKTAKTVLFKKYGVEPGPKMALKKGDN